jgi:hypothetical protein
MLGHRGRCQFEKFDKLTNTQLLAFKGQQNAKPVFLCQRFGDV